MPPPQAHSRIGLTRAWGGGEVASADGLRFVVPVRSLHSGPNRKYFHNGEVTAIGRKTVLTDALGGFSEYAFAI